MRVVVVGAGMSGLSAGFWISERARAEGRDVALTVLEAAPVAGGHVRTERIDGYTIEAGPNGFLDNEPATLDLMRTVGLEPALRPASAAARRRFIVRGGRLRLVPDSPPALLFSDALSLRGKLRFLLEPFVPGPPPYGGESVYEFARRRVGSEAAEVLVDAAVSGISGGDSRQLSVEAAFPLMVELERRHGSLIRGIISRRRHGIRAPRLHTLAGGLASLVEAVARRLGSSLRLAAPVARIQRCGGEWRVQVAGGETLAADRVVLATPAWRAAELVAGADGGLAAPLSDIPAVGVAVVALGYAAPDIGHPLKGYGYLVTAQEALTTLGVVWESSLFDGRAPEGRVLLRAMLGGARVPGAARFGEDELVARATSDLARVMGVRASPRLVRVYRWPAAIPQYTAGHLERVARARAAAAALPGLALCGTSYDGIALNAAIASGARVAARLLGAVPAGAR